MLFGFAKMTLKSIKSVETAIITGKGLVIPQHQKSLETNPQNFQATTNQLMTLMPSLNQNFQATTNQLMTLMPSVNLSNCRFKISGQDG